jgi:hypothetical protein
MVRAIQEGRKTQTRRIIGMETLKVIPRHKVCGDWCDFATKVRGGKPTKGIIHQAGAVSGKATNGEWLGLKPEEFDFVCPYAKGQTYLQNMGNGKSRWCIIPEDSKLWVKETFWIDQDDQDICFYAATDPRSDIPLKPSIFMPRKYSRITLAVKHIRIERLQDISEEDAVAEGCLHTGLGISISADEIETAKEQYQRLWDSINGKGSWESNPMVWVIEFKEDGE